jgi:hypothetical protein
VENLLSDVPSAVKEFVEKNNTTGGRSYSENSERVGNHNSKEEEDQSDSVVDISSLLPKNNPSLRKSDSHKSLPLTASIKFWCAA